jgi:hypothetical protein
MSSIQRRRRNVLVILAVGVLATFGLAFMAGPRMFWLLFVVALAALVGYTYLLVHFKHRATARYAAPKRVYATPVAVEEDEAPKVGDNVVVLRRSVG